MSTHRTRRARGAALLATATIVAASLAACSSDDDDGDGGGGGDADKITVWIEEDLPDRVAATQAIVDAFTAETGIEVELVAVAEDQFNQILTSNAAAGELPDVMGGIPLGQIRTLSANELARHRRGGRRPRQPRHRHVQRERARAHLRRRRRAGDPERVVGAAAGLPQGPLRAGRAGRTRDVRRRAGRRRGARQPRRGRLRRRQRRRRRLHRADLRGDRPRQRLRARRRRGRGHLRQRRVRRGAGLLRPAPAGLLGHRCPGRRHHAGVVLRRSGRDDHLVELHPRRDGRAAERRAADLPGVRGRPGVPGQEQRRRHLDPGPVRRRAGHLRRDHVVDDPGRGGHRPGQAVRRVHDDRRLRAVDRDRARGQDPGPRRCQRRLDGVRRRVGRPWTVGVDTKAPLSQFYGQDVIDALTDGHRLAEPVGDPAGPG